MSLNQLIKHLNRGAELSGKKSFLDYLKSWEFGKMIQDGNIMHGTMFKGPSGKEVGKDYMGNIYMEDNDLQYTRKRWVVFGDKFQYDLSTIPAEWHGWLNYATDQNPIKQPFEKPFYSVPAKTHTSGQECVAGTMYQPKGAWSNPQKRNWVKFETWAPTTAAIANTQALMRASVAAPTLPKA